MGKAKSKNLEISFQIINYVNRHSGCGKQLIVTSLLIDVDRAKAPSTKRPEKKEAGFFVSHETPFPHNSS